MDIRYLDLGRRHVPYREAWQLQRDAHAQVVAGELADTLMLVEHASVYTAGKRTATRERPVDGTEVIDVDRGGRITWHGPGQLVGYPIVKLSEPIDVVKYVRQLEQAMIDVCATFGVETVRIADRSGVWVQGRDGRKDAKICAIGVRVAKGVTMHGFALNCHPDLSAFDRIIPCGIDDADVTSLTEQAGKVVTIDDVVQPTLRALDRALADVRLNPSPIAAKEIV